MKDSEIVKVEPINKYFSVNWRLTSHCNYDCMYCPSELHDNTGKLFTLEDLKRHWESIYAKTHLKNLKYKIFFTGGEVTINKYFFPFLEWLNMNYSNNIFQIIVTTNGSASTNYYRKLFRYVSNISFSLHSEHVDEKKFFDTVLELKKTLDSNKFVHVNIMNEFWNIDRINDYKKILDSNDISYTVNEIDYSVKTRKYPIMKGKLNLEI
jgi:hypothetical protein